MLVYPHLKRRQEDRQTLDTVCLSSCHLVNVVLAAGRGGRVRAQEPSWKGKLALWIHSRYWVHPSLEGLCELQVTAFSVPVPSTSGDSMLHGLYPKGKCETILKISALTIYAFYVKTWEIYFKVPMINLLNGRCLQFILRGFSSLLLGNGLLQHSAPHCRTHLALLTR